MDRLPRARALAPALLFALIPLPSLAHAHEDASHEPPPETEDQPPSAVGFDDPRFTTRVRARSEASAASSATVRDRDFLLRPRRRPADLLQVTPGLLVLQHAGGGKANQYFLRGFDLDHGTDLAITVDGIPVNMPSHAHGQGYADLSWVIPETIERVEVRKGPYFASVGDFGLSGAVNLVTREAFTQSGVTLTGGRFDTYRALLVASGGRTLEERGWKPFLAAEVYATNGPFVNPEALTRYNLFTKVTRELEAGALSLGVTSYSGAWNGSGQLPLRAVQAGTLDRFGSVDSTEGGASQRHNAFLHLKLRPDADTEFTAMAYASQYRMSLFSNFTLFSADPGRGDQITQTDDRVFAGMQASLRKTRTIGQIAFDTSMGVQLRTDAIENALSRSQGRQRLGDVVRADVNEGSLGVWVQEDVRWTPWLRTVLGLRGDLFGFEVRDRLADPTQGLDTSGVRQAMQASPKLAVIVSPTESLDLFADLGRGFHSNDARGVVRKVDPVTPLTPGTGAELGARWRITPDVNVAATAWILDLNSELVWVGDEGTTEAVGPTRRLGLDLEARARLRRWVFLEGDLSLARATFVQNAGNANALALAPLLMGSAAIALRPPNGFFARLGFRGIGARPATEDRFLTAEGWALFDVVAGWHGSWFEVSASIDNALNAAWREAQFANTSRLPGEAPTNAPPPAGACPAGTRVSRDEVGNFRGCEDLHFTPGWPVNPQVSFTAYF